MQFQIFLFNIICTSRVVIVVLLLIFGTSFEALMIFAWLWLAFFEPSTSSLFVYKCVLTAVNSMMRWETWSHDGKQRVQLLFFIIYRTYPYGKSSRRWWWLKIPYDFLLSCDLHCNPLQYWASVSVFHDFNELFMLIRGWLDSKYIFFDFNYRLFCFRYPSLLLWKEL